MIKKIITNNTGNNTVSSNTPHNTPFFGSGPLDLVVGALQVCEANPMLNVTVLDLSTAIIPRTVVETQTNPDAGFEAFRRESSGLVINCLIPGFVVAGMAWLTQGLIMKNKTMMTNCWANQDTIEKVTDYWKKSQGINEKEKVKNTVKTLLNDIKGVDGDKEVKFKNFTFNEAIDDIAKETINPTPKKSFLKTLFSKKEKIKTPSAKIIEKTHINKNIKIGKDKGYFSQDLESIVNSLPKILNDLKSGVKPETFAKKATTLVKTKSLLGLAVILPLAMAAQPLNRWITSKRSGKKGAPIYKDFQQSGARELSSEEKASLAKQKLISVGSMITVALISIGKFPSKAMCKSVTQFKGIFPTMDQARLISATTFSSRMMSSEDKNDLREATFRDIATFLSFYFIGDYVSKFAATIIQKVKPHIKLINDINPLEAKDKKSLFKRIGHWMNGTALKSTDELHGTKKILQEAKKMRGVCQLVNILVSLVALGLVIPKMYRKKTEKEHEKELQELKAKSNKK
jgi:hypothetical protein